jgi:hypothetical protein
MVAAANTALSATADGNQKKPGFPGFIPPGANPQQVAAALAARTAPNVLAGTGLGLTAPAQAPAMYTDALGPRPVPQPEPKPKMGWNDVPPLRAPDNARNIYAGMGVDDLKRRASSTGQASPQAPITAAANTPVGGLAGLAAMQSNQSQTPAPAATPAQAAQPAAQPSEYAQQMGNVANFFGDAASGAIKTLVSAPGYGLSSSAPKSAVAAPAQAAAPAVQASQSQRGEGSMPAATPATAPPTPASAPARNASGALTSMGAGTDVVGGIKKYVVDGKTLYSNMGDEGQGGNLSLMNRGAPSAQNVAAMDNLVARSTAEGAQAVQRLQFQDQVAQAKAINARPNPVDPRAAMDITSPQYQAARLQKMDMQQKSGESPAAYQTRMQAMVEGQRTAQAQASEEARLGLGRDTLAANTKQADAKNAIDQGGLWIRQQQVANDQETWALTRDQKRMEMDQAKKIQALQEKYMTATGAEQEALGKQLLTMSNKDPKASAKDNFMVVGGGQEWDAQANSMRNVPQRLIDLRTGLAVSGPPNGGSPSASFVEGGIYPLTGGGSAVFKDGKLKRVE